MKKVFKENEINIDKGVAESYYLENEAWNDISVSKNFGPSGRFEWEIEWNCSNCSRTYEAFDQVLPCPHCAYKEIDNDNNDTSLPPTYHCANGCGNTVSYSGEYCLQHANKCSDCSTRISYEKMYCSSHQPRCRNCRAEMFSDVDYCSSTTCQKSQQKQNEINNLQNQIYNSNQSISSIIRESQTQLNTVQQQLQTEQTARQNAERERNARPNITNAQWTQTQADLQNERNNHQQTQNQLNNVRGDLTTEQNNHTTTRNERDNYLAELTDLENIGERLVNAFNEAERTRIQAETERDNLQTQLNTEQQNHQQTRQERDNLQTQYNERNNNQDLQTQIQELQERLDDLEILPLAERIRLQERHFKRLREIIINTLNDNLLRDLLEELLEDQNTFTQTNNNFIRARIERNRQRLLNNSELSEREMNRLLQARIELTRLEQQQQNQQQAQIQVPPAGRNN